MYINELAEAKVLVIFGGRFQPFHQGHAWVYNYLVGKFGRQNVYIGTTGKVEPLKTPFTLSERVYFMNLQGVPSDRIVQIPQNYSTEAIQQAFNISNEAQSQYKVLFAVSEKDMAEDPRFQRWTKKDGTPSKLQKMPDDLSQVQTMDKHGYILTVPTKEFTVLGKVCTGASDIRALYEPADEKTRQQIIADVFGKYTREAEQIFNSRLLPAAAVEPAPLKKKTELQKVKVPKEEPVAEAVSHFVPSKSLSDQGYYKLLAYRYKKDPRLLNAKEKQELHDFINSLKTVNEEAAGVGVVNGGKDPRYVMATTGDQNDVTGKTPMKNLRAFGLAEDLAWVKARLGEGAVNDLATRHVEYINQDILAIKQRIATEKLPPQYIEKLKQKIAQLEQERARLAFDPK